MSNPWSNVAGGNGLFGEATHGKCYPVTCTRMYSRRKPSSKSGTDWTYYANLQNQQFVFFVEANVFGWRLRQKDTFTKQTSDNSEKRWTKDKQCIHTVSIFQVLHTKGNAVYTWYFQNTYGEMKPNQYYPKHEHSKYDPTWICVMVPVFSVSKAKNSFRNWARSCRVANWVGSKQTLQWHVHHVQ